MHIYFVIRLRVKLFETFLDLVLIHKINVYKKEGMFLLYVEPEI